jgi:hypothetical protein
MIQQMKMRILSNGCGDIIVAAEIDRRGRRDYIPAENWRDLEPAALAELESRGVGICEAGIFECPPQIAERAKFGFEVFWAQTDMRLGDALSKWRQQVLGASNQVSFARQHGVSRRAVRMLERHSRVPRRADVRSRLEQAYRLPEEFLRRVEAERAEEVD